MAPTSAFTKNPRPAFKPPRPITSSTTTSAPDRHLAARPQPAQASPSFGFSDSDDDAFAPLPDPAPPLDDRYPHIESPSPNIDESTSHPPSTISPALLTKLLHDNFHDPSTRITKSAMALFVKYVDTFAAEAVARAIAERREVLDRGGGVAVGRGMIDDFLQVEDLEKLAPQLLLDF